MIAALKAGQRMRELLAFLPNLIGLCGRLMLDHRVSKKERAFVAAAIAYAVAPLDLVPDLIPFIGQVDDAYLVAVTLLRMINRTDEGVVREHWRGSGDVLQLTESLTAVAPLILPNHITRVLGARAKRSGDKAHHPPASIESASIKSSCCVSRIC